MLGLFKESRGNINKDISVHLAVKSKNSGVDHRTSCVLLTPRKEVIHPLLPERIPCYDLAPIASLTLGAPLLAVEGIDFGHY